MGNHEHVAGEKPDAGDVKHAVEHAIKRNDAAVAAAWAAPGVLGVDDHLLVA